MAQTEIITGLVADDDMDDGYIRVGEYETWFMSMNQFLYLQELGVGREVSLFLDLLGPGIHQLPAEYCP